MRKNIYEKKIEEYAKNDAVKDSLKNKRRHSLNSTPGESSRAKRENYLNNGSNPIIANLRDEMGLARTFNNFGTVFKNMSDALMNSQYIPADLYLRSSMNKTQDMVETLRPMMRSAGMVHRNFGELAPTSQTEGLYTIGAVDIQMQTVIDSIWSFFGTDHGMVDVSDRFVYTDIVAKNANAGLVAGATAYSQFSAPNLDLDLSDNKAVITVDSTGTGTQNVNMPIKPGSVQLFSTESGKSVVVGQDTANGFLFVSKLEKDKYPVINYTLGTITFPVNVELTDGKLSFIVDRAHEEDGAHTLKVREEQRAIPITASVNSLQYETNFLTTSARNKILNGASALGLDVNNPYESAMNRVMNVDRTSKNNMMANALIQAVNTDWNTGTQVWEKKQHKAEELVDLTNASYMPTIDYLVGTSITKASTFFLNRTGLNVTAYIVDSTAYALMAHLADFDTAGIITTNNRDGLVGTYMGIPVVRVAKLANSLNIMTGDDNVYGTIIGVHKSPDGEYAPTVFGEFLPPVMPINHATNYLNPLANNTTLVSMVSASVMIPSLCFGIALKAYPKF